MKVIAGLGNPGDKYAQTRHNIGFAVLDYLADHEKMSFSGARFDGHVASGSIKGEKILLVKPTTYMNLSGEAVMSALRYYKVGVEDLIVVYDEMDFALGQMKLAERGGSGGHNGIKSIIEHVGHQDFHRLRVGIGKPEHKNAGADFVLSRFSPEEKPQVDKTIERAYQALLCYLESGMAVAMNRYNSAPPS